MRVRLAAVALVAVVAVGCGTAGGGTKSASDAASLVPAGALAFLSVNTDPGSGQLQSAQSTLDKFPVKDKVLQQIDASLAKNGLDLAALKSSVGPETDVAVLRLNGETGQVGFTQPADEEAFDAELDKKSAVHTTIDGWTVFAAKQPFLDAVTNRQANLSDSPSYQAAVKTVPAAGDAIVRAYAAPGGIQTALGAASGSLGAAAGALQPVAVARWAAAALTSADGAFELEVHAKSKPQAAAAPASAGLAGKIPSGSILALSLTGGSSVLPPTARTQLGAASKQLGFDVGAIVDALNGPVIAYVRAGLPLPEVTIAAQPSHPARAARAVGQIVEKIAPTATPVPAKVDGGTLLKADLGSVAIYYGVADGLLVVTDSANALAELNGSVGHLSGDSVFKEAKAGAGMADSGQGFLYVNLKDAVPAVTGFAQLANQQLPANVLANLKPLRSLLVYGSRDADVQTLVAYLKTS